MTARAQSLVEFALIAPIVILLAMAAWDGGSALREQVVLQQAARDGARAGATAYGGATQSIIQDAVLDSAADLPALASSSGYLSVASDAQSITVTLRYPHALLTPILRQLWSGGRGTLILSATSTFYLPQQTPVPATIVPSTPIPSVTPTPTPSQTPTQSPTPTSSPTPAPSQTPNASPTSNASPTATASKTPTVTPTPTSSASPTPTPTATPSICSRSLTIPPLGNNSGYWVTLQLTSSSLITAGWSIGSQQVGGQIEVFLYAGNPFNGQPNPTPLQPPANALASAAVNANQSSVVGLVSPQAEPAGTYSVYFFKIGDTLAQSSNGGLGYSSGTCS